MCVRRFLLVAPSELSTGEAITLLHMAEAIEREGDECVLLAGAVLRRLAETRIKGEVVTLTDSRDENRRQWRRALAISRPHAIVFGDYPLLFHSSGSAPLADEQWVSDLCRLDAALVTLDHLGLATQGGRIIAFGPPHMTFAMEVAASLPGGMRVLLPCPNHDPVSNEGMPGILFRCWSPAEDEVASSAMTRVELGIQERERLVLYLTPAWARRVAGNLGLPHHRYVMPVLREALDGARRPVVVVSIGAEPAVEQCGGQVRHIGLPALAVGQFEHLLAAADLVITDSAISSALGKAIRLGRPCAVLINSYSLAELQERGEDSGTKWARAMERERLGSVFPWDVFPVWDLQDLQQLGIDRNTLFRRGYARVEMFGGEQTRARLSSLLDSDDEAQAQADARHAYNAGVAALPSVHEALRMALA